MSKKQHTIPFRLIDLDTEGSHLLIDAKVNSESIQLIVDTGASKTAFDLNYFSELLGEDAISNAEQMSTGIGTNTMESFQTWINIFQIGDFQLKNYNAALLDLGHINFIYKKLKLPYIHGVLGNDILVKYNALINYKQQHILLDLY